ncbi:MAG: uridine kinase, partial [Betaproteobacteria bacterium]|nr:uridine kinase [Betaproteobacteria bacterium]
MKPLFLHPLFALGLLIRLALIVGLAPLAVVDWYAPFLDASIAHLILDPWSAWLADGGTPVAFPYGYAMWLAFLPLTITAKLLGLSPLLAYALTLLASDLLLLLVLQRLVPDRVRLLLAAYWLSPIVILATYGLGLNDLIPVLLLTLSIHFTRSYQLRLAGALCSAA